MPAVAPAPAPAKKPLIGKPGTATAGAPATVTAGKPKVTPKVATVATPAAPVAKAPKPAKEPKAPKEPKPPKERLSASEEELQAAIDGTLTPRDRKGDAAQESLGGTGENGKPKGRPIGVTTGLPILLAWCYIFQYNETLKEAFDANPKKNPAPWTDEQIAAWMKEEFPGRATAAFDNVNGCRNSYNKGNYTRMHEPKIQSKRYDETGAIQVGRTPKAAGEGEVVEEAAPAAPKPPKAVAKAAKPTITTVSPAVPAPKKAPPVVKKAPVAAAK